LALLAAIFLSDVAIAAPPRVIAGIDPKPMGAIARGLDRGIWGSLPRIDDYREKSREVKRLRPGVRRIAMSAHIPAAVDDVS
jgi:hypothetical protein